MYFFAQIPVEQSESKPKSQSAHLSPLTLSIVTIIPRPFHSSKSSLLALYQVNCYCIAFALAILFA